VKAVVMAGGEGTRLRPMTSSMPKPLLPVANRPIMEHVLRLLRRHGLTEVVVTVQFLASLVRNYFGDGEELGMVLHYANEEVPLGTAGSVKNAEDLLSDDSFVVISGDALTDIDLTALIAYHKEKGALVTVCLTRVPDPVEFGITITDDEGRVERFLEKPTWGQVFSDTVNTGIYVMEPEVFDYFEAGKSVDWSSEVFPQLLAEGKPVYGYVAEGYWEDVGTHESYVKAQADVLTGKVNTEIDGFETAPGVFVAEGAEIDPAAILKGPCYIGAYSKIEAGVELREHTVIGSNVVVKSGAFLHRAVMHDNVYIGPQANLRGCVVGKNTDVMRAARIEDGVVVGRRVPHRGGVGPLERRARLPVQDGRGRRGRAQRRHLGAAQLALPVRPARNQRRDERGDHPGARGPARRGLRHHAQEGRHGHLRPGRLPGGPRAQAGVIASLTSSAINVRDLESVPTPVARLQTAHGATGGVVIRTTPGRARLGGHRVPRLHRRRPVPGRAAQAGPGLLARRVPARVPRRDRRPGTPSRIFESYVQELMARVDTSGITEARAEGRGRRRRRRGGPRAALLLGRLGRGRVHGQPRHRRGAPDRVPGRAAHRAAPARRAGGLLARRPSACASTRSASGSGWSTTPGRGSTRTGRCW
jgi:mannose-1-phosphate guanylyltransferase/phosphomannomutase